MEYSEPAEWVGQQFDGYVVNAAFSDENKDKLETLLQELSDEYGDHIFPATRNSIHITLFDWIAPLVTYDGKDKGKLYEDLCPSYDAAFTEILNQEQPIEVIFDTIGVSPSTIYITGHDNGQFARIRQQFVNSIDLLPNTKMPPRIIHSSLARFTDRVALDTVRLFIGQRKISFTQQVDGFRLVHTTREPMLEFEQLKYYSLG